MARIASGVKRMKTIGIQTKDISAFEVNDRIVIKGKPYLLTHMETRFSPNECAVADITLTDAGQFMASNMLWEEDGLTLTGTVRKAMTECKASGDQDTACFIAGRIASRLQRHIECAQAGAKRAEGYLEAERARSKQKDEAIAALNLTIETMAKGMQKQTAEITRLRSECVTLRQGLAQYGPLFTAVGESGWHTAYRKTVEEAKTEIKALQSKVSKKDGKITRYGKKINEQNKEIHRLNEIISTMRSSSRHDDMMDALSYAIHPNCRCAEVPMDGLLYRHVFATPKHLEEGDTLSATIKVVASEGTAPFTVTEMGLFGHATKDSEGGLCEIRIGDQLIAKGTIEGLDLSNSLRADTPYAAFVHESESDDRGTMRVANPVRYMVMDEHGIRPETEDYATMCPDCGKISGIGGCPDCARPRDQEAK